MKGILPISALLLLPGFMMACSCLYYTSFCERVEPTSKLAQVRVFDTILEHSQFEPDKLWIQVIVEERLKTIR